MKPPGMAILMIMNWQTMLGFMIVQHNNTLTHPQLTFASIGQPSHFFIKTSLWTLFFIKRGWLFPTKNKHRFLISLHIYDGLLFLKTDDYHDDYDDGNNN